MNNLYDFYRGHDGRRLPQEFYANHWRGSKNQTQKQYLPLQLPVGSTMMAYRFQTDQINLFSIMWEEKPQEMRTL